jgi:hypothetical protein
MLAVASAACGGAPAKAPAAHGSTPAPFFPPGTDLHWLVPQADPNPYAPTVAAPPKPLAPDVITSADPLNVMAMARFCDSGKAVKRVFEKCAKLAGPAIQPCAEACLHNLEEATLGQARQRRALPASPSATPPPPLPTRLPDSFERVLGECVLRVRESGGSAPAVCRFDRPLDDMDFGQLHCNARCAAATAP